MSIARTLEAVVVSRVDAGIVLRVFGALLVCVAGAALVAPRAGAADAVAPALQPVDFGQAFVGGVVNHRIQLENAGSEPIRVTAIRTSCGCLATDSSGFVIAAGEKRPVDFSLKLEAPAARYSQHATFLLEGYDPIRQHFRGSVTAPIPAEVDLGRIAGGESHSVDIAMAVIEGRALAAVSATATGDPSVAAHLSESGGVVITVTPEDFEHSILGFISVQDETGFTHTTKVIATVDGLLSRQPSGPVPVFGNEAELVLHGVPPGAVVRIEGVEGIFKTRIGQSGERSRVLRLVRIGDLGLGATGEVIVTSGGVETRMAVFFIPRASAADRAG